MQDRDSGEVASSVTEPVNDDQSKPLDASSAGENNADDQLILDVSGKNLEFSVLENCESAVKGLYLYKNVFNLIPQRLGELGRLKTLKFFANEINLFPHEFRNLVELECLQVKLSSPGLNGLPLHKLRGLKELELCKVPPRPSAFPLLSEIAGLKCLTKLSVCHFSIRYLPPEIGCLYNLEDLDLSFNKMKSLPTEISHLSALMSLKVANNKLVELPSGLSSLRSLENLDLSNNRLTSLGSLELGSMHNLQNLNLQYNKLLSCCQIPSWICCNLEGNGKDACNDEFISSSVEMDVFETTTQEIDESVCCNGSPNSLSTTLAGSSSSSRCFVARMSRKGWKRRYYLQQRARQERLNSSRKWKSEEHAEVLATKASEKCENGKLAVVHPESLAEHAPDIVVLDQDDKQLLSEEPESEDLLNGVEDAESSSRKGSYDVLDSIPINKGGKSECNDGDVPLSSLSERATEKDEGSSSEVSKNTLKSKRHSDRDLDNPKPCKARRPVNEHSNLSCKYSKISYCNIEDRIPDGFYDAGRDRPFMPLTVYEQNFHIDSREVILLDRERDEELDAIFLSAQALVFRLKQLTGLTKERKQVTDNSLQVASLLALFVSDHFGGSDKSALIERTRKSVSGSNYQKPFVCSCSTGNRSNISTSNKQNLDCVEDIVIADLCEKSLRSIKARRNSIIVPIGTLQFGVCRHRAVLMKYLCDRMEPPVPCELVRGYLDFLPHAWNVVCTKRGDSWVRMIVDACRPHDIREETDPEYFCRYIPLSRINVPLSTPSAPVTGGSFPSLSRCDEIANAPSSSLIQCKFGSFEAAAKVRSLEVCNNSVEEVRNFEYCCLGEVRILGALKHSCIVEMYGHQISSKWIPSTDGNLEHRVLQSAILMEHIKGGSLKSYLEKLSEAGEKHVPVELALCIARDVASALAELHSKHIIHRDIKSENILIDLDKKRADRTPVVKLCDFDRAVPLRSFLHSCCIAHAGIPPPDVCVGTPRWMAPEVLQAMHKREIYGLEVDIWSYGCLLLELLTLQVPYFELSEAQFHDQLQMGKRPQLPEELEGLNSQEPAMSRSGKEPEGPEAEVENLRFLVDLFLQCTERNPTERPTAENVYKILLTQTRTFTSSS